MNKRKKKKLIKNLDELNEKYFTLGSLSLIKKVSKRFRALIQIYYRNSTEIYLYLNNRGTK